VPPVSRKIKLLAIQLEDPRSFTCLQLMIRIECGISKHEIGLFISPTVDILERSGSQNTPQGELVTTMDKRVPDNGTPLTKKRSLAIELQAEVTVCSAGHPKQIIQGAGGVMHCKEKKRGTMISSTVKQT